MEVVATIETPTSLKQGLEVYCRLKGGKKYKNSCITILSNTEMQLCRPDARTSLKYKFKRIFDQEASQKFVFDSVSFKLIQELLGGTSGLLFAYGVTGSGKTYSMIGTKEDPGIMPRCLDVIFNSISPFHADKHVFKPDKLNGFEIQSEEDARLERELALRKQVTQNKNDKQPM